MPSRIAMKMLLIHSTDIVGKPVILGGSTRMILRSCTKADLTELKTTKNKRTTPHRKPLICEMPGARCPWHKLGKDIFCLAHIKTQMLYL